MAKKTRVSPLDRRSSGILLHPTSLPGAYGSGDLGPAAYRFIDFLHSAGQTWWQMLPVGPVGAGFSPYDSPSSFAGNPMLISLELLAEERLLTAEEIAPPAELSTPRAAQYESSSAFRESRLALAARRFFDEGSAEVRDELEAFLERNAHWLTTFSLYDAVKREQAGQAWFQWEPELRQRRKRALRHATERLGATMRQRQFEQFQFARQWARLRRYARQKAVGLLGDLPMFVAHDGADVWLAQRLFYLDAQGHRTVLAGVPPDYFSEDGQLWGNPLYRWEVLKEEEYRWLVERMQHTLARFDAVRLDHFIAFHRYWEIPAGAATARHGRFVEVPGRDFFKQLRRALGGLPFVAEDLGLVTPEVRKLRERFGLPGMSVLQFGFAEGAEAYLPHRAERDMVVYTGTHDNNTIMGWLQEAAPGSDEGRRQAIERERRRALEYAGSDGNEFHWDMIRLALMSVVNTAIFPMQDVLGLDASARMNVPGTPTGNWRWRLLDNELDGAIAARLLKLSSLYQRVPSDHTETAPPGDHGQP